MGAGQFSREFPHNYTYLQIESYSTKKEKSRLKKMKVRQQI